MHMHYTSFCRVKMTTCLNKCSKLAWYLQWLNKTEESKNKDQARISKMFSYLTQGKNRRRDAEAKTAPKIMKGKNNGWTQQVQEWAGIFFSFRCMWIPYFLLHKD